MFRSLTLCAAAAVAASFAQTPKVHADHQPSLRIQPELPVFGMRTYNDGYGERIVRVRRGGVACRLGLEPGDTIVRLNRFPLRYHGAWHDALGVAMQRGGLVRLKVIDGRTGRLAQRQIQFPVTPPCVEPFPGPITPKLRRDAGLAERSIDLDRPRRRQVEPRFDPRLDQPFARPFAGQPVVEPPHAPSRRGLVPEPARRERSADRLTGLLANLLQGRP